MLWETQKQLPSHWIAKSLLKEPNTADSSSCCRMRLMCIANVKKQQWELAEESQWAVWSESLLDDTCNCPICSHKHLEITSLILIPREQILSASSHSCLEAKPHSVVSWFQASVVRQKEACQLSAFPSLTSSVSSFWHICWPHVIVSLGQPSGKQILLHPSGARECFSPDRNPHSSRQ